MSGLTIADAVDTGDRLVATEAFGFGQPVMRISVEHEGEWGACLISPSAAKQLIEKLSDFVARYDGVEES